MSWSLNIGKVAGTVVRIHLTFLLFLAWIFAASYASGGAACGLEQPRSSWCCCSCCVLPHEFGHIFTARAFGVPTPYVTLLPIGGVAQLERIPEEPCQEFLIADRRAAGQRVPSPIVLVVFGGAHPADQRRAAATRQHAILDDRPAGGGEPVPRAVQHDPGVPDGRRPRAARAAREQAWLCARHRNRRRHRPVRRLRARLHRPDRTIRS